MTAFKDIVGQEAAARALSRAIASGRVGGPYLFWGAGGVGKCSTALALAQALNCERGRGDSCGACPTCGKIERRIHPDIMQVAPKGNTIRIEQVRELREAVAYPPHEGRYRVIIIDGADYLTVSAANAMLKTLEEPRTDTVYVLTAIAPQQVIATIRSRCQLLPFRPLSAAEITQVVRRRAPDCEDDLLAEAISLAEGSAGRTIDLLSSEELDDARNLCDRLVSLMEASDVGPLFEASRQLSSGARSVVRRAFDLLRRRLRDELLAEAGASPCDEEHVSKAGLAIGAGARHLIRRVRAVQTAEGMLARNANPQLTLEHLVLELR